VISILIPTYNESENIVPFCRELLKVFDGKPLEIVIVDDDSPDGTARTVTKAFGSESRVRLEVRRNKRGLTSAITDAFHLSRGDVLVRTDADFSLPPGDIVRLVEQIESGCDFAFASRYVGAGQDHRGQGLPVFLSRVINFYCQTLLSFKYRDYTSCFYACRRKVMDKVPLEGDYGEFFIHLLWKTHKEGFKIQEMPYTCQPRREGVSKTATNLLGFLKRGIKYMWMAMRLRIRSI